MAINISDKSNFNVISEAEAASVICRFSPEMVSDAVNSSIESKSQGFATNIYNIVEAIETGYKSTLADLPSYSPEIQSMRHDTYLSIINQICAAHNLQFTGGENWDLYSTAWIIYDFFVGNFSKYIVQFFTNYIVAEKFTLYEALQLESKKESSPYSQKLFKTKNSKLAAIHANLEFVIQNICQYDVDLNTYIDLVYLQSKPVAESLKSMLLDNGDFYKQYIINHLKTVGPIIYTEIRFALQGYATMETNDIL